MPVRLPAALSSLAGPGEWQRADGGESGGTVWRLEGPDPLYLKYGAGPVAGDIVDEAVRLRWLSGRVACPEVRFLAVEAEAAWLLTTALPGLTGDEWLTRHPDSVESIVCAFAAFLRELHALPVEDCPFDAGHRLRLAAARRNVAEGRVDETDFDEDHLGWSAEQMLAKTLALAPKRTEPVVTHGDCSLGNLLIDADGKVAGCIDVGRLGVADRYQDIAIFWNNLADFGADAQRRFLDELGVGAPDEARLEFHRCLDELF